MPSREEIIKSLEGCMDVHQSGLWSSGCMSCAYEKQSNPKCFMDLTKDAVALLREQPEQKHGHWIEYPKCLEYDGALDDTYIVCSACEHVFNVIDNCTELFDYCPKCGAKMDGEAKQNG